MIWGQKLAYGLPAFSLAVVGIPVYIHIPKFYTDVVGLNIAWVGTILLLARVFDAVSDPVLGILSDRMHTSMGRRRPFIVFGGIGLAIFMAMLFIPPMLGERQALLWFAVSLFLVFLFWTVVTVPYEALGPEICTDYTERTTLFAVRDGLLIAGTLMAAAAPAIIDAFQGATAASAQGERRKFLWIAILYGPLVIASTLWCVYRIRESAIQAAQQTRPKLSDLRGILQNRPFLILLAAYTISAIGSNLPATLILFYVEYVIVSPYADLFLLLYFASGILMLPAWIKLADRYGKKAAWLTSMALNTCAFSGVYFLGAGDAILYGGLVVVSGLGFGATLALPSSIQADVIDYDEFLTGKRQEGWYIGVWSVVKKLAAAVGVGAGLTILGVVGYVPGKNQPPEVIQTLKFLYALVPSMCNLVAFFVALKFPLSRQSHQKILDGIGLHKKGEKTDDPLDKTG